MSASARTVTVTMMVAWVLMVRRTCVPASEDFQASQKPVSAANTDTAAAGDEGERAGVPELAGPAAVRAADGRADVERRPEDVGHDRDVGERRVQRLAGPAS